MNEIDLWFKATLDFFNSSQTPVIFAGCFTLIFYLLVCFIKSDKIVVLVNALKAFPTGCGIAFGIKIMLIAIIDHCNLTINQNVAFFLGGLCIVGFAINALHIFISKSVPPTTP